MLNLKNVVSHFDERSVNYDKNSENFPWSLIRSFEAKNIKSLIGNVRNKVILDVGSGTGYYSKIMINEKAKKVYALDLSFKMLNRINEKKIVKVYKNAENFYIKKKFEIIICAGLLEFVNSPLKVLKNARRVAKTNCKMVILYPVDNFFAKFYKSYHLKNNIKINLFSENKIENILNNSKWKILKKKNFLFSSIILVGPC